MSQKQDRKAATNGTAAGILVDLTGGGDGPAQALLDALTEATVSGRRLRARGTSEALGLMAHFVYRLEHFEDDQDPRIIVALAERLMEAAGAGDLTVEPEPDA